MKKLLAIILAAVMMLSMAACGNSTDTEDTSSNNKNEGTNNPTLVVDDDSLFMDEIEEHLAEYAKEDDQFEYELLSEEDKDYFEWEFEEETGKKISGEIVKAYFAEYYDEEYDEDAELYIFEFEKSTDADIAEEMFIDWYETSGGIYDYFRKGDIVMCGDAITIEIALEILGIETE